MTTHNPKFGPRLVSLVVALATFLFVSERAAAAACTSVNVATTSVVFGSYNPLGSSQTDSTGEITVNCSSATETVPPLTSITIGTGRSATFKPRNMLNATDAVTTLGYNLFIDAGRTTIWGDGTGGTSYQSLPAGSTTHTETFTIYGRIPGNQSHTTAGSYSDSTLSVVISY